MNKAASSVSGSASTTQGERSSEASGRSYQMPIVMRDSFQRDRKLLFKMQASGASKRKTKLFVSSGDSDNVSII